MKCLTKRLIFAAIVSLVLFPFSILAQDEEVMAEDAAMEEEGGMLEEEALEPTEPFLMNSVELGVGYSSEDSFKFGEYTGLEEEGFFAIGNISLHKRITNDEDYASGIAHYWDLVGTNLGLDSRYVYGEYGNTANKFNIFIEYDQIPHFRLDDARTVYRNAGSTKQTLPSFWATGGANNIPGLPGAGTPGGVLNSSLQQLDVETERQKAGGGFSWQPLDGWAISGNYHHEFKDGTETIAGLFGTNGGNPRGSILITPVDFETDEFDLRIGRVGEKGQFELSYHLSYFNNNDKAVEFDNPFETPPGNSWCFGGPCGGFFDSLGDFSNGGIGRIALAPDNIAHQLAFSGGYNLAQTTRVTTRVSYGWMEQDEDFLPYDANGIATVPLPRSSLDGEIQTLFGNVSISSRPTRKLNLRGSFTYDDRDNDTPRDIYQIVHNDVSNQGALGSADARVNRPYSIEKYKVNLDAGYRLTSRTEVSLGYDFEDIERDFSEVDSTREHTGSIKLQASPTAMTSGWIRYAFSTRDASTYKSNQPFLDGHTPAFTNGLTGATGLFENNFLVRKYNLAERDRNELVASLSVIPTEKIMLGFRGTYTNDDYDDSAGEDGFSGPTLGLLEDKHYNLNLDIGYTPAEEFTTYGFFTYEHFDREQRGFQRAGIEVFPGFVFDPGSFWTFQTEDSIYTIGAGLEWRELLDKKLNVTLDYVFTFADTESDPQGGSSLTFSALPNLETRMHSLSLRGDYKINKQFTMRLGYRYEYFKTDDFALDGVNPDTLSNVILLGNRSPDYNAHVVGLSLIYEF